MDRNPRKLLFSLAALAAIALTMSGCVIFAVEPTASQQGVIGSANVHIEICPGGTETDGSQQCFDEGPKKALGPFSVQVMLGLRVPDGSAGPDEFQTQRSGSSGARFVRRPSLAEQLEKQEPAPPGQHWVGYLSERVSPSDPNDAGDQTIRADLPFTLPPAADGGPFQGPFLYRPTVSFRFVDGDEEAAAPVQCAANTQCIADPALEDGLPSLSLATRDVAVLPGSASAQPGTTASVPFTLKYAGEAAPEANFALSATTNVPGAAVAPSQANLAPGANSTNPASVTVNVPANAAAGTYDVALTAKLANGQERSGTAKLTVTPAPAKDTAKPRVKVSLVRGQDIESMLDKGLAVKVNMSEPGSQTGVLATGSAFLARNIAIGRKTIRFAKPGTKTVRLKLSRKARNGNARKALLARRKVAFRLSITAKDLAGNVKRVTKRFSLKR